MANRIITVVLEILDKEAAKQVWDSHLGDWKIAGCRVLAIGEGRQLCPETLDEEHQENCRFCREVARDP